MKSIEFQINGNNYIYYSSLSACFRLASYDAVSVNLVMYNGAYSANLVE